MLIKADARQIPLRDGSVQCVVTSPPYWGLRDYGVEGQIGLERTPDEYVAHIVAVFREVRRVLRDDGTLWLNLGDSYAHDGKRGGETGGKQAYLPDSDRRRIGREKRITGLPPKSLVGIPWRVAFALQADGWYLRSDIIWSKENPMPESVTDRPTRAHEYIFLLAKGQWKARVVKFADLSSERLHLSEYVGSQDPNVWAHEFAVRLASAILDRSQEQHRLGLASLDAEVGQEGSANGNGDAIRCLPVEHPAASAAARFLAADASAKEFLCEMNRLGVALSKRDDLLILGADTEVPLPPGVTRYGETAVAIHHAGEVRQLDFSHSVIISSRPSRCTYYYDAEAIREPYAESTLLEAERGYNGTAMKSYGQALAQDPSETKRRIIAGITKRRSIRPCDNRGGGQGTGAITFSGPGRNKRSVWTIPTQPYHGAHFATFPEALIEPCILAGSREGDLVFDPFIGSGTVGVVADRLLRRWVGLDLNYHDLAKQRTAQRGLRVLTESA